MVTIGFYEDCDLENLFHLFSEWEDAREPDFGLFKASVEAVHAHRDYKILIAKDDNIIVGYAQIGKFTVIGYDPLYEVIQLLVSGPKRGKGIGRRIMERIEEIALSEGIKVITLSSQVHRSRAHTFYEDLGYALSRVSKFYQKVLQ